MNTTCSVRRAARFSAVAAGYLMKWSSSMLRYFIASSRASVGNLSTMFAALSASSLWGSFLVSYPALCSISVTLSFNPFASACRASVSSSGGLYRSFSQCDSVPRVMSRPTSCRRAVSSSWLRFSSFRRACIQFMIVSLSNTIQILSVT